MRERAQSTAEEVANAASHALGFVLALAGAVVLVVASSRQGNAANVVGAAIFAATMLLLYLCSALYHAAPPGRAKRLYEQLDHAAIFLFIAGSYTPFALAAIDGAWGWALFALVWGAAVAGLALKACGRLAHPLASSGVYVALGWLLVVAALPLLERVSASGVFWLFAGAAAYTAGVVFYLTDARVRFGHFVWHLFVIAGSGCHFFAVLGCAQAA